MPYSSIHVPDDSSWHHLPAYSSHVARMLEQAYREIKHGTRTVVAYEQILQTIRPLAARPMAWPQWLRVRYVLGMCYAGLDAYTDALRHLAAALAIATDKQDWAAYAEVAFLSGSVKNGAGHFAGSMTDQLLCVTTTRELREQAAAAGQSAAPLANLEMLALIGLSTAQFMRAHFDDSAHHLGEAARLFTGDPLTDLAAANITWLRAIHDRWKGSLESALAHAQRAAEVYARSGPPAGYGRIQAIVADIAMDLAESFPATAPTYGRNAYLTLARPYIERALTLAREQHDQGGEGIALLALARMTQLTTVGIGNALPAIESVLARAGAMHDTALRAQAYYSLGREFAAHGEFSRARACYRLALSELGGTEGDAMRLWPQRALLESEEMHPDG
jgi:tetratricopeptide (TPR) repeat protein